MNEEIFTDLVNLTPPGENGGDRKRSGAEHLTDTGNARRFQARERVKVRHVAVEKSGWYLFDGTRHVRDQVGEIQRRAIATVVSIYGEIEQAPNKKERDALRDHARRSEQEPRIRAMLSLAKSLPGIALAPGSFDCDAMLFGVGNGVLDLRDGSHRPARPDDLISRGSDVTWQGIDAAAPRWDRFLAEIFDGDVELIDFLRRLAGYCLTGDTSEQVLTVLYGTGCNGKTELVETLKAISGRYAATAAFDTFTRTRGGSGGPRNDLARLAGARLVVANESAEGNRLDEAIVKQVTGSDTIAARFLYGEHFEYQPQFKPILVSNFRPKVDGDDNAFWRRVRLVPFNQSFEGREDRRLRATLRGELPGILAWAVRGCLEWQEQGLGTAAMVAEATRSYRQDSDLLGAFLEERCTTGGEVLANVFRGAMATFCEELGEEMPSASALGQRLKRRGIESKRGSQGRLSYLGVAIR